MNSCPDSNLRKTNFSSEKFLSLITEWIHSEYSKYSLHPGPRSQEEAVALCSSIGKQLVEPRSVDTNAEIIALAQLEMMSGGYGVWIGIDDKSEEGSFKYASDGSPIHYTNWISGFYGYHGNQDCVLLRAAMDYKWDVAPCSLQASFICEPGEPGGPGGYWPTTAGPGGPGGPGGLGGPGGPGGPGGILGS